MKFLAINTAAAKLEVALQIDNKIFVKSDSNYKKASEVAMVYVDELLTKNNLTLQDLDFCTVVVGPGSFTGVRIGVSMARIFGQFSKVPLVAINSLEVLAHNSENSNNDNIVVTVSDAANGFSYIAVYENYIELLPPTVIKTTELSNFLSTIEEEHIVINENNIDTIDGQALCTTSLSAYNKNGATMFENIVPLYIRKSQAEENF